MTQRIWLENPGACPWLIVIPRVGINIITVDYIETIPAVFLPQSAIELVKFFFKEIDEKFLVDIKEEESLKN